MPHGLLPSVNILCLNGNTSGTAAATTSCVLPVNMAEYEGCLFLAFSETTGFTAVADMFISECATSGGTFLSLAEGGATVQVSAQASTSVSAMAIDVYNPHDQFLKAEFTTGTIGDINRVLAIQYGPRKSPVVPSTAGVGGEAGTTYGSYTPFISGSYATLATPSTA